MGKHKPNRLRVLRAELRITQLALAKKARLNVARVSFFENGHAEPTAKERTRLARALKTAVSDVFPEQQVRASA